MRKHSLDQVSEALRYLKSRGWSLGAIHQAVKDSGVTAVELADRIRGASA